MSSEISPRTYRVTITGSPKTGSDPSSIEIFIKDDGSPDSIPLEANLTVYYKKYQGKDVKESYKKYQGKDVKDKDAVREQEFKGGTDAEVFPLFVNKGTVSRVEESILIRDVYLTEAEKSNGTAFELCSQYAASCLLQELLAYGQLFPPMIFGIKYSKFGDGNTQLRDEEIQEKLEEVLGHSVQFEVRQFVMEYLFRYGDPDDSSAVISQIFPDTPYAPPEESIAVREDVRKFEDPEKVMKNAGLSLLERQILELGGENPVQGIPYLARLLGQTMNGFIQSEPNESGLIEEWLAGLNSMNERIPFPHPAPDQERFAPLAIKTTIDGTTREELSESGSGTIGLRFLQEHQTHSQVLKFVRSLNYFRKEEFLKKQGESLDYAKVYWDERDTPHQGRFMAIVLDRKARMDEIYEVCLRLEGRGRAEGEVAEAVYTEGLYEDEKTSMLPITKEMGRHDRYLEAEIKTLTKKNSLNDAIKKNILVRI